MSLEDRDQKISHVPFPPAGPGFFTCTALSLTGISTSVVCTSGVTQVVAMESLPAICGADLPWAFPLALVAKKELGTSCQNYPLWVRARGATVTGLCDESRKLGNVVHFGISGNSIMGSEPLEMADADER